MVSHPHRAARTQPELASKATSAVRSPAIEMQAKLAADLGREDRWSPSATLGFVALTCGGFWSLAAWGVSRLLH